MSVSHWQVCSLQPQVASLLHIHCGFFFLAQTLELEAALSSHYCVSEVKSLGHGSAQTLVTQAANRPQKASSREQTVVYEAALCAKSK